MSGLPNKYRPTTLDEVWGNTALKESLASLLEKEDHRKTFLFKGPPGCGKTTLAYVLKKHLGIADFDFHEYDTANTRGIDTTRKIVEDAQYSATSGKCKMFLLDECHQITGDAFNAILKTLESPPANTYFVLCTAEFGKVGETLRAAIKRRCSAFEVNLLSTTEATNHLQYVLEKEGFDKDSITDMQEVIDKIISISNGSPGESLSLLDNIIDLSSIEDMLSLLEEVSGSETSVREICQLIIAGEREWKKAKDIVKNLKGSPETLRRGIIAYLGAVLVNSGRRNIAKAMMILSDQNKTFNCGKAGLDLMLWQAITDDDLL